MKMSAKMIVSIVLSAVATLGCSVDADVVKGNTCIVESTRAIAANESTQLGTPVNVAAALGSSQHVVLRWFARDNGLPISGDTELTFSAVLLIDSAKYQARSGDITSCPDLMIFDAQLDLATADGTWAEQFAGTVTTASGKTGQFEGSSRADQVKGSYNSLWLKPFPPDATFVVQTTVAAPVQGHILFNSDRGAGSNSTGVNVSEWPAL